MDSSSNPSNCQEQNNSKASAHHAIEIHSPPCPGEWGWIMSINGQVSTREYGLNSNLELLVGQIVCDLMIKMQKTDGPGAGKYNAWIATVDGKPMGCIACTQDEEDETVGKLRLLIVAPEGRGLGLGSRLVNECISFAKAVGYKKLGLWTQGNLVYARKLYDKAGFSLVSTFKDSQFGPELDGQLMELDL